MAVAKDVGGQKQRSRALLDAIDEAIKIFEQSAPSPWEAHYLLHALGHLRGGFLAVAAEEIASAMKPRDQQIDPDGACDSSNALFQIAAAANQLRARLG